MKRLMALAVIACAWFGLAGSAMAENHNDAAAQVAARSGIQIPALVHNQMLGLESNRAAVVALAAKVAPADAVANKLRAFVGEQFAACGYGLVPYAVADTLSAFHACSHAYLAGTKALLMRVGELAPADADVKALNAKVDADLFAYGVGVAMCLNSAEGFDTARVVPPDWTAARTAMAPYLLALLILAAFGVAAYPLATRKVRLLPDLR